MAGALELSTHVLIATLLMLIIGGVWRGARSGGRLLVRLDADPAGRVRFYRRFIVVSWTMAALAALITISSADLSAADVGWVWPGGNGIDYLLALYAVIALGVGGRLVRRRMQLGHAYPGRQAMAPTVPRNAHERRWATAVAFTAGITEEVVYRGLLIGAATKLYHVPIALAVTISLLLFVANHAYMGPRGMLSVAILASLFTTSYLISGSILLAIVVHVWQDVVALLLIPAHPSPPPPPAVGSTTGKKDGQATSALRDGEIPDQPAPPLPHVRSQVPG